MTDRIVRLENAAKRAIAIARGTDATATQEQLLQEVMDAIEQALVENLH